MIISKDPIHGDTLQEESLDSIASEMKEQYLPLLPLKNVVILPKSIVPIIAARDISIKAIEHALKHNQMLFITSQKDPDTETPTREDIFEYGTRAVILQVMRMPNNSVKILAEGICRAKIDDFTYVDNFIGITYHDLKPTDTGVSIEIEALWKELCNLYYEYARCNEKAPADLPGVVKTVEDMGHVTDAIAVQMNSLLFSERQALLEQVDLSDRILFVCNMLKKETEILKAEQRVRGRVQTQVEKNHREYYLTEQMKAIQKELGRDDQASELDGIRKKLQTLPLPDAIREKGLKELKRLEQMPPLSSEAVVSRHYIEWIVDLPWQNVTKDAIPLSKALRILDKNHAGLKKLKDRIVEFLAAQKFSKNMEKSPIICFAGPPGVGKTSLARSIAESLGREFVRISLGGVRDEAEIRGHRRTYIGALPGKIIQAMKKSKSMNPVILLDEIDKMSRDYHGDPSAALLEVLDPEQNKTFMDHFLDIEYDLSKVMFIATANVLDNIPYPLFDRLEIIQLSGYTEEEKLDIAKKFLIPKNLKEHSLTARTCKFPDPAIRYLIDEYTKEAGVRQLDRLIAKMMRKTIQATLLEDKAEKGTKKTTTLSPELIKKWIGTAPYKKTSLNSTAKRIGLAIGLAWTEVGGDILEIETTALPGKGGVTLTGQLGEVMQESAQAAISYIRSRAVELALKPSFHASKDIHIHLPEGATPKDGPSAGIAICTALTSALTKIASKEKVAMTGEITLQGRVLAIGGLKEKLLAAKQHGITTVIIPKENEDDLEEIKKEISLDNLTVILASTMDDILKVVLVENPFTKKRMRPRKARKQ